MCFELSEKVVDAINTTIVESFMIVVEDKVFREKVKKWWRTQRLITR